MTATASAVDNRQANQNRLNVKLKVHPVILAGGSGTRLWPMSREQHPKQLIGLLGEDSLLQSTTRRLDGLAAGYPVAEQLVVVCNEEHRFTTAEQLRSLGVRTCLAKPFDVEGLLALVQRYAPAGATRR